MSREINDENYLEELFVKEVENAGGGSGGNGKWELLDSKVGYDTIALPNDYSELLIEVLIPYSLYPLGVSMTLNKETITDTTRYFDMGASSFTAVRVGVSIYGINLNQVYAHEEHLSTTSTIKVYYR